MTRAQALRRLVGAWRVARREPPPHARVTADRLSARESAIVGAGFTDALRRVRPPGAQIAIRRERSLLWAACAGRVEGARPVAPEDRFVLASATKPVTACVVALL